VRNPSLAELIGDAIFNYYDGFGQHPGVTRAYGCAEAVIKAIPALTADTPAQADKMAAAEAGIYAAALLKIERELDQYRGAKVLREGVRRAVEQARSQVAELTVTARPGQDDNR